MKNKTPQELLVEHIDLIQNIILKIVKTYNYNLKQDDIDDIFQNVCEILLDKGFAQYRGECKIDTYLFSIIRREVIRYATLLNKVEIESQIECTNVNNDDDEFDSAKLFEVISSINPDYTKKIIMKDIISIIDDIISTFDERDKLIFMWFFLCKKSQTEIAEMIKLSQPTVFERIEKIKKRIASAIKKKYHDVEKELLS